MSAARCKEAVCSASDNAADEEERTVSTSGNAEIDARTVGDISDWSDRLLPLAILLPMTPILPPPLLALLERNRGSGH